MVQIWFIKRCCAVLHSSKYAQLVPDGFQSGSVYTGPLRMLIYVVFPASPAAASEMQQYRFAQPPASCVC